MVNICIITALLIHPEYHHASTKEDTERDPRKIENSAIDSQGKETLGKKRNKSSQRKIKSKAVFHSIALLGKTVVHFQI
jgi:hypothetical protein